MISAFGIDHGSVVSKAKDRFDGHGKPSGGRYTAAYVLPGTHAAVAGKKGAKLRSAGNELTGSFLGGAVGVRAGAAVGRHVRHVSPAIAVGAGVAGSVVGTRRNQRKGYYKKQDRSRATPS